MGRVADYLEHRLASDLRAQGVVVWYDPGREWAEWIKAKLGDTAFEAPTHALRVGFAGLDAQVVPFTGSYYELVDVCERILGEQPDTSLLVYVCGEEPPEALSPLRELECLGGERERYRHELPRVARGAFERAGLADAAIDELLASEQVSFAFLDQVRTGQEGGASPLQPIFGTSREEEVFPRFLGEPAKRLETASAGRLQDVVRLLEDALGTPVKQANGDDASGEKAAEKVAEQLARVLLVAEMRSDLTSAEPREISRVPAPSTPAQLERARTICDRVRKLYPEEYEVLADHVEEDLGLAEADIDGLSLGRIDTFRFEERRLLAACNGLLAKGEARKALDVVTERSGSFWASIGRYPERHAAWEACGALARLGLAADEVNAALKSAPKEASEWVHRYAEKAGWHRMDRLFREARYRLTQLSDQSELQQGAQAIFSRYEAVIEPMASRFVDAYRSAGWELRDVPSQAEIYHQFVSKRAKPVAYLHVDAMRYEMGAELADLVEKAGAQDVEIRPAAAVAPTITDLGMVALLPGAESSFSMAKHERGIAGVIDGRTLANAAARMDYAKGAVPGLVEITLDRLLYDLDRKGLEKAIAGAPVVIIRSQEIDGAGENLPDNLARTVMGSVLENVRQGILKLAQAGIKDFVITADHGHLYGPRRGDDMKIDPPGGGQQADIHRRCWVGRGGDTPSACVRLSAGDLGYSGTDLDLVVPKGLGVFRAGGSLSFHHGGLSLQELVIPVLSFTLERGSAQDAKRSSEAIALEKVPKKITNMIFSLNVRRADLPMEPLRLRMIVEASGEKERRIVGQAIFATKGWDGETLLLEDGDPVSVGIQIDDEGVTEVRVLVVQVETDRLLKDTAPIPVSITR